MTNSCPWPHLAEHVEVAPGDAGTAEHDERDRGVHSSHLRLASRDTLRTAPVAGRLSAARRRIRRNLGRPDHPTREPCRPTTDAAQHELELPFHLDVQIDLQGVLQREPHGNCMLLCAQRDAMGGVCAEADVGHHVAGGRRGQAALAHDGQPPVLVPAMGHNVVGSGSLGKMSVGLIG